MYIGKNLQGFDHIYGGICVYNVAIANVSSVVDKLLGYVCVRFESYG